MKPKMRCPAARPIASFLLAYVVLALAACAPQSPGTSADVQASPAPATPAASAAPSTTVPADDTTGYYVVSKNGREGVVDESGQMVLPLEFADIEILYDGSEPVLFFTVDGAAHAGDEPRTQAAGMLYALDGTRLTQEAYFDAYLLGSGLVAVWDWDGMGVITLDGEQVVPCAYVSVSLCGGSIVGAERERGAVVWTVDLYGMDGTLQKTGSVENFVRTDDTQWGGYIVTRDDEYVKFGLTDMEFNEIFPPVWEDVRPAGNGTFIVCRDGMYGVVDEQGGEVLPLKFTSLQVDTDAFGEGNTVFPASSSDGAYIFDLQWETQFFSEYYASVWVYEGVTIATDRAGHRHLLDADGKEIVSAVVGMYWDKEVQLLVCQHSLDSGTAYYTRDGVMAILPDCDSSMPVGPDRFIIMKEQPDGSLLYGLCDAEGNMILPMQYSELSADRIDFGGLHYESGQYLIFTETNEFDTEYSGVMDMDGNVLLPAVFDNIYPDGNLFRAWMGTAYGLVDQYGNWVWQASDYEALLD